MEFSILQNFSLNSVFKSLSGCLVGLSAFYLAKILNSYQFFKKRGLKTPKYEFFFGNFRQIIENKNYSDILKNWTEKYGKTYGYFEGHLPVLVTSDLEIIQEIFVKQYANFSARKKSNLGRSADDPAIDLFESTKLRWKKMRTLMNPTFSSAKLRELGPLLILCSDRLISVLENETEKELNISEYLKRFTMDSIWNCAFGVDINMQFETENEYFNKSEIIFKNTIDLNFFEFIGVYFHEFKEKVLNTLFFVNSVLSNFISEKNWHPFFWIRLKIIEIVEKRKKQENSSRKDYVQLLLDAETDFSNDNKTNSIQLTSTYFEKKLSMDEIKSNLVLFMLAGYETTSTTLSYCCYVLATHIEEQQKLYEEITSYFSNDANSVIDSDSVQQLEYLDMFIKEVLRMFPIANKVVARRCTKATNIKGIDIPEDLAIAVDVLSLHYDADIWGPVDPNQFYPERFSKDIKRNPLAFMAFGNGPRNCIGMKFALIELKIALVKLLKNFELKSNSDKLELIEGVVRYPKNGVNIYLKGRA
nr:cytochrome p450 CYP3045C1 [Brachionus angularis]